MRFGIREILFIVVLVGLLFSSWFFVIQKSQQKIQAMERLTVEMYLALADLERATAGVADVDMKVEELEEAIKFFEKKLPQEREMDQILKEVWEKADKNRLTTKTIRTMKSQKSASYSEQPIELNIAGDFKGFYEFLLQLERMPRLTRISQLSIDKMQNSEGQMEAKMTMSVFFEPENSGGGATASVR